MAGAGSTIYLAVQTDTSPITLQVLICHWLRGPEGSSRNGICDKSAKRFETKIVPISSEHNACKFTPR
jgi:hypothetical protein